MSMWFEMKDGHMVLSKPVDMKACKVDSQIPEGRVSTSNQKSGWIAKSIDGRMFDEAHHEWKLVPKDMLTDIRMVLRNTTIIIPKIPIFVNFFRIKRTDGQFIGTGAITKNGMAMYTMALNKREGVIFTVDHFTALDNLPYVGSIELMSPDDIKEDVLPITLPSSTIIIPRRQMNNYFFQYKDGVIYTFLRKPLLFGQAMGVILNKIGNCLVLYYDQLTDVCMASVDNIFSMKMSLDAQGLPLGHLQNPMTGEIV